MIVGATDLPLWKGRRPFVSKDARLVAQGAVRNARRASARQPCTSILIVPAYPLHRKFETVLVAALWARGRGIGGRGSAPAGSQVVRIPGLQARPLGGGTSIDTEILLAFKPLWPAGRRVLPHLLP